MQDHKAKLQLCSKYLENFSRANEKEKVNTELLIDLLFNMREIIMMDHMVGFRYGFVCNSQNANDFAPTINA